MKKISLENYNIPRQLIKMLKSKNKMKKTKRFNKVWLLEAVVKDNKLKTLQRLFIRVKTRLPNLRTLKS